MQQRSTKKSTNIWYSGSVNTEPFIHVGRRVQMKQIKLESLFLCLLFILLTYLFSRSYYSLFFITLFVLLLLLGFFKENNRLFSWLLISFFMSYLILFYIDLFIDRKQWTPYKQLLVSQLLLLIPIITSCYVIMKFKIKICHYFTLPSLSIFRTIFTILLIGVSGMLLYYFHIGGTAVFFSILLFTGTRAILEEVLWRGILLTQIIKITNERVGLLVTSVGFGLNTTIFGFTPLLTFMFILFGLIFGYLTVKTKSILPAIFAHVFVLHLLFISGYLSIPI
jgi:uncharacterized protein